jgi:hypothetical protein
MIQDFRDEVSSLVALTFPTVGLLAPRKCRSPVAPARLGLQVLGVFFLVAGFGLLAGCTDISIARARHQAATGDYTAAHQYFAGAIQSKQLSRRERREVMDGLCRTETKIGAPTYSLTRQVRTCAAAVTQPGSESGPIFAEVEHQQEAALATSINAALAQHDIARADDAILRYRALPDHDQSAVNSWTRQVWTVVNREAAPGKVAVKPAIVQQTHHFRHLRNMNRQEFRDWVQENMVISGTPIVSNVEVGKRTVDMSIDDDQLAQAALNLDRFARVNDGLVARCGCDGYTKVALKESGLPAYLIRLVPESLQSEVLILNQQ